MAKITLVGFGSIGQTVAVLSIIKGLTSELVCIDLNVDHAKGFMADIEQSLPIEQKDVSCVCTSDYAQIKDSDIIVITAGSTGIASGENTKVWNRDLMLKPNTEIISDIAGRIKQHAPNAFVIVVTNPVDTIVDVFQRVSGLPHHMVVGEAGTDDNRLRYFVAKELGLASRDVDGFVIGPHGNNMMPIFSTVKAKGLPVILTEKQKAEITDNVVFGAKKVIDLCGVSPFRTVATAILETMDAYIHNRRRVLGLSNFDTKEGCYYSWPCIVSRKGVERRLPTSPNDLLDSKELAKFHESLKTLKESNEKAFSFLKK